MRDASVGLAIVGAGLPLLAVGLVCRFLASAPGARAAAGVDPWALPGKLMGLSTVAAGMRRVWWGRPSRPADPPL